MTTTYSTNLVKPEVWALALMSAIKGRLVFAANFAQVFPQLEGQPGDTLNLTEFARLTNLTGDQEETVSLTPEAMSSSGTALTIREASKAVNISWRATKGAFGSPIDVARAETARVISHRVDSVLVAAATSAATAVDGSTAIIDYAAVIAALASFGDSVLSSEGIALVVHSKQYRDLLGTSAFTRPEGNEGSNLPGYAGLLDGSIPVFVSDLITTVTDGGGAGINTYTALIFQGTPLAYAHKSDIETNQADDILARTTTVASTLYFAGGVQSAERIVALETL